MNARAWLACVAAMTSLACGGEDKGPRPEPVLCRPIEPLSEFPDPGSGTVDCSALDGYELFILNTFEPGEYVSGWYTNNDRTAQQEPAPDSDPVPTTLIPGGLCAGVEPSEDAATICESPTTPRGECTTVRSPESRNAVRIQTGFMTNNGGVFGHSLPKTCIPLEEAPACAQRTGPPEIGPCSIGMAGSPPRPGCTARDDFSDWDGVVVWARRAPGSSSTIRVRVSDPLSDDKGCVCQSYTNQNDASNGCDKFGTFSTLDETFRPHFFPFKEMQQGGWGLKSPGLDQSDLREVAVEYRHGAWDIWLDDIAFYRRKR